LIDACQAAIDGALPTLTRSMAQRYNLIRGVNRVVEVPNCVWQ
jgi:hypothetical protein